MFAEMMLAAILSQDVAVTPGWVLLRADTNDLAERAKVVAALTHADPDVRIAAARVVGLFGDPRHATALLTVLSAEADGNAALEQLRGALFLLGDPRHPAVQAAKDKLGRPAEVLLTAWENSAALPLLKGAQPPAPSRVIPLWVPRLLESTAAAAGCRLGDQPQFAFARVTFGVGGRPGSPAMDPGGLSKPCARVLSVLTRTILLPPREPFQPGEPHWFVVPFGRDHGRCGATIDPPTGQVGQRVEKGVIGEPRKTKDVRPQYPEKAQQERRQGLVIIESVIAASGCVRDAKILKSASLDLDLASLIAVSQWEFTATTLNGVPVPVIMTVTVSFNLR